MNSTSTLQPSHRSRKGPVVACRAGKIGLEFSCGHFVEGFPVATPGAKVRGAIDASMPCPTCWPLGFRFHQKVEVAL